MSTTPAQDEIKAVGNAAIEQVTSEFNLDEPDRSVARVLCDQITGNALVILTMLHGRSAGAGGDEIMRMALKMASARAEALAKLPKEKIMDAMRERDGGVM